MDKFFNIIPENILNKGIRLEYPGYLAYAFYFEEMLIIADLLKQNNIAVLGGDVMVLNDKKELKYSPTCESWSLDYKKDKIYEDYVKESINKMLEYIKLLLSNGYQNFLYISVLADKEMFEKLKLINRIVIKS